MYMRGKDKREEEDRQDRRKKLIFMSNCLGSLKYKFNSINDDIIRV